MYPSCVPCVYHYSTAAQTVSVGRICPRYGNSESCSTNSSQVTTDNRKGIGQQIPRLVRNPNSSLPFSEQPTFRRHPEPDKPNPHTHIVLKTFTSQSTLPNGLLPSKCRVNSDTLCALYVPSFLNSILVKIW